MFHRRGDCILSSYSRDKLKANKKHYSNKTLPLVSKAMSSGKNHTISSALPGFRIYLSCLGRIPSSTSKLHKPMGFCMMVMSLYWSFTWNCAVESDLVKWSKPPFKWCRLNYTYISNSMVRISEKNMLYRRIFLWYHLCRVKNFERHFE